MGKKHASQYANFGWLPTIKSIYSLYFNVSLNAKPFAVRKAKSIALFIL